MTEKALAVVNQLSDDQVALIKRTVAQGTTNDELQLFLYTAKRIGLDPLANQIRAVKRWNEARKQKTMAIQVGIDSYRLIADRTNHYAPGPEPTFSYNGDGQVETATAYVKKLTDDGTWHVVAATAHYSEYCGRKKDGEPNHMWANKPHIMLGKCAEALALRRAFPAELSGVYTREEMDQADNPVIAPPPKTESTSESRRRVNNNLWLIYWKKAEAAGIKDEGRWNAVADVRPDLFPSPPIPTQPETKEKAQTIIDKLTEQDFQVLFSGLDSFEKTQAEPGEWQMDLNRATGETREPGCDDE